MGKFYGAIGYAETVETSPGVYVEVIKERKYSGDIIKSSRRLQSGEGLNDNMTLANDFSILADPYAYANFSTMRYIEWMGGFWKITQVNVQRPRLILTTGGVYNGEKASTSDAT